MDGFPNGRRLEDDVTTIELQAVSGVALAAIGLWYDDYTVGVTPSPVTPDFLNVYTFNGGVTNNDTTFQSCFPYEQTPWRGFVGAEYKGSNKSLAVRILKFILHVIHEHNVQLDWQVADQQNVSHYEIERSTDAQHYVKIGEVNAIDKISDYTYTDMNPDLSKVNYYRVKEVDNDGKYIYTPVRFAKFDINVLSISPNPATSYISITSTIPNIQISIYDATGRKMLVQQMTGSSQQIPVSSFAKGIYTVVAQDKGVMIDSKKIVIQ